MMWMAGSTVSIISLMMISMVCFNPLKALFSMSGAFAKYQNPDSPNALILPKLLFLILNVASVGVGMWKLNSLGLVPTPANIPPTADVPDYLEFSAGAFIA